MKAFFSYFGSKSRLAKFYQQPRHKHIIEPFAGAAGYATHWAAEKGRPVTLVDADQNIFDVWTYLKAAHPEDILALPVFPDWDREREVAHQAFLREIKGLDRVKNIDEVKRLRAVRNKSLEGVMPNLLNEIENPSARKLVGFWMTQSQTYPSKNPQSKAYSSGWTPEIRKRIAEHVWLLQNWRILLGDYKEVLAEEHGPATWFIDPPYQKAGCRYQKPFSDFKTLSDWSASRQGQVIVCEQAGADWMDFKPLVKTKNASNRDSMEVVWNSDGEYTPVKQERGGKASSENQPILNFLEASK